MFRVKVDEELGGLVMLEVEFARVNQKVFELKIDKN